MQKTVAVNDAGQRIGEDHPNAKLTDRDIDLIRHLHEKDGLSYAVLAEKFEVGKSTIQMICQYRRRAQSVSRFKKVHVPTDG